MPGFAPVGRAERKVAVGQPCTPAWGDGGPETWPADEGSGAPGVQCQLLTCLMSQENELQNGPAFPAPPDLPPASTGKETGWEFSRDRGEGTPPPPRSGVRGPVHAAPYVRTCSSAPLCPGSSPLMSGSFRKGGKALQMKAGFRLVRFSTRPLIRRR